METELLTKINAVLAEYRIANPLLACDIAILVGQAKIEQIHADMAIVGA